MRYINNAHIQLLPKIKQMKYILIATFFFLNCSTLFSQTNENSITIGEKYIIKSKILDENRNYYVYLPSSYKTSLTKKYIVVYVLDGDKSKFTEVTGIVQSMNSIPHLKMQIPEVIVVSIENTDRVKDFTPTHSLNYLDQENVASFGTSGKANDFMNFIEKELMPKIDTTYRTISKNMIVGHSLGGLFAIHSLLENPSLFDYYILIDPSWFWDHNYIGKRAKEVLLRKTDLKARVYISLANNSDEDDRHYKWGQEFYQLLENNTSSSLNSKIQYFADEKHLTVPLPSTYYGLRYIFDGFEISDFNKIFETPSIISKHYEKVSQKLGMEFIPDENYINTLGYTALYGRNLPEISISIFEINTKNHPLSLNAWDSLAEAYSVKGNIEKARKCYEKILSLDQNNMNAKNKLEKLK
jgi:predicted alpha/beta superfamily hydrolase